MKGEKRRWRRRKEEKKPSDRKFESCPRIVAIKNKCPPRSRPRAASVAPSEQKFTATPSSIHLVLSSLAPSPILNPQPPILALSSASSHGRLLESCAWGFGGGAQSLKVAHPRAAAESRRRGNNILTSFEEGRISPSPIYPARPPKSRRPALCARISQGPRRRRANDRFRDRGR